MTPPNVPPPAAPPGADEDSDFSDSDQAWFDRLSASSTRPAANAAEREADLLRSALDARDEAAWARAMGPDAAERRRQQVHRAVAAAQAARPQSAVPAPRSWWSRWRDALFGDSSSARPLRWGAVAALASIAAIAVILVPQLGSERDLDGPPLDPGLILRGGDDARVQRVDTATPRRAAETFAADLRSSGLRPGLYRDPDAPTGSVVFVDVDIEPEHLDGARRVFGRHSLSPPSAGFARVVFSKR